MAFGSGTFRKGATVNLQSGGMTLGGNATFSAGSAFNWSGGSWSTPAGAMLSIEGTNASFANSPKTMSTGSTLRLASGGFVITGSYFDIPSGTMIVQDGESNFTSTASGSLGYSAWGGAVGNSSTITFSNFGVGSFNAGLQVGVLGGRAVVNLQSVALLDTASLLAGSTGRSDGVDINVNNAKLIVDGAATFQNGAKLNLQTSGIVNFNAGATFATGSTFNWSAGGWTNDFDTTIAFDGGAGSFTAGGGFNSVISLSDGSTLRITNNGMLQTNFLPDIGNREIVGGHGTLLVDSGTLICTAPGITDWGRVSGDAATITFQNAGFGSFSSGLNIGANGGAATVNILSSAKLNTTSLQAGIGFDNSAGVNITVNGGTLNIAGNAEFENGATLNLKGNGSVNFGGGATFSTGSTFNWSGGVWDNPPGTTLAFDGGTGSFSSGFGHSLSNGSVLRILGGTLRTDGEFDISAGTGSTTGTMFVSGGTFISSATGNAFSSWGELNTTTATITFANSGVGSYNAGLNIGAVGGAATVNIRSFARLGVGSLLAGYAFGPSDGVNITVDTGGELDVLNNATFNGGVTLTAQGSNFGVGGDLVLNSLSRINYNAGSFEVGGTISMNGSSRVILSSGRDKTLIAGTGFAGGLFMSGQSKLDLADNTLLIGYTGASPLPLIRGYLLTGRAGGPWTGGQLTSSSAAAVFADPMNPHKTALGYREVNSLGFTQLVVQYAYLGDANLDGTVNALDFNAVATNFGGSSKFWFSGDFDYNGTVDTSDFTMLASNFGQTLTFSAPPISGTLVPEPTWIGGLGILGLLGRRRSRRLYVAPFIG